MVGSKLFQTVKFCLLKNYLYTVNSEELKECLSNPHVREILKSLVQSQTPETAIQDAMKEPIFLETAHACLKVIEPEKFQPELGKILFHNLKVHQVLANPRAVEVAVVVVGVRCGRDGMLLAHH